VKPANLKEYRRDGRLGKNQSGKREIVVVVREREGSTLPAVFKSKSAALGWISSGVAKGTALVADEASSWNALHNRYEISRINHQQAYSLNGVYSNGAESFFSRLRRAEMGHHHHVAGPYLVRYAQENVWRGDKRRVSNGDQLQHTVSLALASRPSVDFCGYWQRHKTA
jgi:ISXO2-like transposase domain